MPTPDNGIDDDFRNKRIVEEKPKPDDLRTPAERDYDRVIYTSAFMRLAGISQVAHASDAAVVHNRLTHSLKVAAVGRGLAVRLRKLYPDLVSAVGGLDADAVAAAAIAHDLGHPPFGHVAEEELDELVRAELKSDAGFEGNAQSFRVVTKLAIRKRDFDGLNLTRVTLNGMLKYPWMRESDGKKNKKFGAYHTENKHFEFARERCIRDRLSAEAEVMNFADDVAYSTHDLEDYYRAGLLPMDRILNDATESNRFLADTFARWRKDEEELDEASYNNAFEAIIKVAKVVSDDLNEPYCGHKRQRAAIRSLGSTLIHRFFSGIKLRAPKPGNGRFVEIDPATEREIALLKQLIWHYVIPNQALATQEEGQRVMIRKLFDVYKSVITEPDTPRVGLFPMRYREQLLGMPTKFRKRYKQERVRIIVDVIAEMTEYQALQTYLRLTGHSPNSFLDLIQQR